MERFSRNAFEAFRASPLNRASEWLISNLMPGVAPTIHRQNVEAASAYEAFPEAQSMEGKGVALAGQLFGSGWSPENFMPTVLGAKATQLAEPAIGKLWSRVFGGAADAAVLNAATDQAAQRLEVSSGLRENVDWRQTGLSAAIGTLFGGGFAGITHFAEKLWTPKDGETIGDVIDQASGGPATEKPPEPPDEPTPDTPPDEPPPPPPPDGGVAPEAPSPGLPEEAVTRTLEAGDAPEAVKGTADIAALPATPGKPAGIFMFDAGQLKVDPETFQFKADGDAEGVTQKLRHVTEWDAAKGNQLVVWQAKDGQMYVADGHQRSGLARRLEGEGHEKIALPGLLFRESDGFSATEVMALAAEKNIAEGSGSLLDAAKIMRAAPGMAKNLQGISDHRIRQANDLARLDEDAWRMAVNDVVTPEQAAIVGRILGDDPPRQAAAMQAIARFEPANADETAALVRKVLHAELSKEEGKAQGSLFGDDPAESTVGEEIKLVAASLKLARGDKGLFARVVNAADTLKERLGAEFDPKAGGRIRDEAALVGAYIQREADKAGPIRTALLSAAREVKDGKRSVAQAARGLVESVRLALGRNDADGPGAGRPAEADGSVAADRADQPDFLAAAGTVAKGSSLRGAPQRRLAGTPGAKPTAPADTVKLHDLSNALREKLGLPAVRMGRLSVRVKGGKVLGQYSPASGVIRTRAMDDFDVLTHEAGHHLEVKLGPPVVRLMRQWEAELKPLSYAGANPKHVLKEGFAEYVRLMMTNPAYARNAAPNFDRDFRAFLSAQHGDLGKAIDELHGVYAEFLTQPSRDAVSSTVVSAKRPSLTAAARASLGKGWNGVKGTIADGLDAAYGWFVSDLNGLERGTRALAKIYRDNTGHPLDLAAADDPHRLARMAKGAGAAAQTELLYGVRGYRSLAVTSPALRDAIVEAMGGRHVLSRWDQDRLQLFGSYLWSRRAIGEWDRFETGQIPNPPDKLTRGDHETAVAEWEREFPAFAGAARKVHAYARALWDKKLEAGLITPEQHDDGLKIADYVPAQRRFDDDERGVSRGGGMDGKGAVTHRFKGSRRDVINPIDSLIADTHLTAGWIARNDAVRALADLAKQAGNGAGAVAEKIPVHELKPSQVDPIAAVENAARAAGVPTIDRVMLRDMMSDMLGDTPATIFRPALTNERGEPIVFYREGGELRALRLADGAFGHEMMAAFNQMTRPEIGLLTKILALPADVARAGITTTPEFLLANGLRDMMQSVLLYGQPFKRVAAFARGGADELLQRKAAQDYNAVGGIMGGVNSSLHREMFVKRDMNALRKRGWAAQRLTSVKGLLQATELSETATRLGLTRTFKAEAQGRGLTEWEATFEAAWRARDYIDFDRRGSAMASLARIIPFFNAALQGTDKVARHMIVPLFRDAVTAEDIRDRGLALKSWARLGVATVAGLSLYALQGDDWRHEEISETTRATHWTIRWGDKYIAVPKPFEFAVAFNGAEALWDAFARQEPGQAERFFSDLWTATAPPSIMQGNPLIRLPFELAANYDLFTEQPIVPEQVRGLEPFLQWTAKTSELSKWLGELFDVSPVVADHVITSFTGSWGLNLLALSDMATGEKGVPSWDDVAVTRRFIKDEAKGSRSVGAFYDRVGRTNGRMQIAASTYRQLSAGTPREAADFLNRQDAPTRVFVTASMGSTEVRRAHPMLRARDAVSQINGLRRAISTGAVETAGGVVPLSDVARGAADDILADLALVEARNALVLTHAPGWDGKEIVDTQGYIRELTAVAPAAAEALADRYATAKVRKFADVSAAWPDLEQRLLREGSDALTLDLTAPIKGAGTELDGQAIPTKGKPPVEGLGE